MTVLRSRTRCLLCDGQLLTDVRQEKNNLKADPYLDSFLVHDSILSECRSCGFAFVKSVPGDPRFFEELYRDEERDVSIDFHYSGKRLIFADVMTCLLRWKQNSGSLLDVGTGTGAFVSFAATRFDASGIELSEACVNFAKSQNLPVSRLLVSDLQNDPRRFDVITLIDVLEHLVEPAETLRQIHRLLKPGGAVYVKVPNYPMQLRKQTLLQHLGLSSAGIMQDFVHINHFTTDSLAKFLAANGFIIKETGFSPPEIWDLRWKHAPKSRLFRMAYNLGVLGVTWVLNSASTLRAKKLGLNFYVLALKL